MKAEVRSGEYRHKKTGVIYTLLAYADDCTNSRDGTSVVIYAPKGDHAMLFVRDETEFMEKFELTPNAGVTGLAPEKGNK